MIENIGPGQVRLDYGPTQMTISIDGKGADSGVAEEAALYAVGLVRSLAAVKEIAARPQSAIGGEDGLPPILRLMLAAVRASGDGELTPMAAVAGTVADMTADWLAERGLSKVIVNNGGDIAIRLQPGYSVTVGLAPALGAAPTHTLVLTAAAGVGGVATSGFGGRSFTKGIATAATAVAASCALADACATSIGNAAYVPHPAIILAPAEELDPLTDIAGHLIVREIGPLPADVVEAALEAGSRRAAELYARGIIRGAALFINNWGVMLPEGLATPLATISIEEGFQWKFAR